MSKLVAGVAALAFVCTTLIGSAGCSWMRVRGVPKKLLSPDEIPDCTSSKAVPTLDLALGVLAAVSIVMIQAIRVGTRKWTQYHDDAPILMGVLGAGSYAAFVSSGVGYSRTSGCREAVWEAQLTRITLNNKSDQETQEAKRAEQWQRRCTTLMAEIAAEPETSAQAALRIELPAQCRGERKTD